jgi:hypothetical protein
MHVEERGAVSRTALRRTPACREAPDTARTDYSRFRIAGNMTIEVGSVGGCARHDQ